jgi:hypothetical protein
MGSVGRALRKAGLLGFVPAGANQSMELMGFENRLVAVCFLQLVLIPNSLSALFP